MTELFLQFILWTYNTLAFQNLGLAIVEIALLSRVVFYPFIKQQSLYSMKMSQLQPHLSVLKEKHKDNKQAFASAQMELFKQHGVNPAAGCLPAVVQIVVMFGLLGAMDSILKMNLNTGFLIWNVARPDAYKIAGLPFEIPGILVAIAAVTQFIQTKMMMPNTKQLTDSEKRLEKEREKKPEDQKSDFMADLAQAQSSMIWMFPLMLLFLGTKWPSGLALYWSVSSLFGIIQQYQISGLGGLEQFVVKFRELRAKI